MNWMWHALLHLTKKADVHHKIFRSSSKMKSYISILDGA
jgi:hypothetical protein